VPAAPGYIPGMILKRKTPGTYRRGVCGLDRPVLLTGVGLESVGGDAPADQVGMMCRWLVEGVSTEGVDSALIVSETGAGPGGRSAKGRNGRVAAA
jgi:hypothetical protein